MDDPHPGYAPCPTCKQYSHSLREDDVGRAFMHFQTMVCENPMKDYPTGHMFQAQTRDAAQLLVSRIEALEAQIASLGNKVLAAFDSTADCDVGLDELRDAICDALTAAEREA